MSSSQEANGPRYYGMEIGVVVDDEDPKGNGRVRVTAPGIIAAPGVWARPFGGGKAQRGRFDTPEKETSVGLWFHRGDPHGQVYFMPLGWANPGGEEEVPTSLKDVPKKDRRRVVAFETERWLITYDGRDDKASFRVEDKIMTGTKLEFDGAKGAVQLTAETFLQIKAGGAISLDAPKVQINGRSITPSPKPI